MNVFSSEKRLKSHQDFTRYCKKKAQLWLENRASAIATQGNSRSRILVSLKIRQGRNSMSLCSTVRLISILRSDSQKPAKPQKIAVSDTPLSFDASSPVNPANICTNLILPETESPSYISAADSMGHLYSNFRGGLRKAHYFETESVTAVQCHPRSSILSPIESTYATSTTTCC